MFILAAFTAYAASIMRARQARLVLKKPEGVMDGRGINDPLYCSDAVPGGVGDRRSAFALLWQAAGARTMVHMRLNDLISCCGSLGSIAGIALAALFRVRTQCPRWECCLGKGLA